MYHIFYIHRVQIKQKIAINSHVKQTCTLLKIKKKGLKKKVLKNLFFKGSLWNQMPTRTFLSSERFHGFYSGKKVLQMIKMFVILRKKQTNKTNKKYFKTCSLKVIWGTHNGSMALLQKHSLEPLFFKWFFSLSLLHTKGNLQGKNIYIFFFFYI